MISHEVQAAWTDEAGLCWRMQMLLMKDMHKAAQGSKARPAP